MVAVVLPELAFGSSDHHLPFGGTLSLSPRTFSAVLDDLFRSLWTSGWARVLLVNGHGGNVDLCRAAVHQAALDHGLFAATVSYWELLGAGEGGPDVPGHAGAFETSAMLALDAEHVRMDLAARSPGSVSAPTHPAVAVADPIAWAAIDGYTDDSRSASAQAGERALGEAARALAGVITDLAFRRARPRDR